MTKDCIHFISFFTYYSYIEFKKYGNNYMIINYDIAGCRYVIILCNKCKSYTNN